MYLYFVDDNNRAYYQSPMFGRILNYLQANPRRCRLREKNKRRSMSVEKVATVAEGLSVLQCMLKMDSL